MNVCYNQSSRVLYISLNYSQENALTLRFCRNRSSVEISRTSLPGTEWMSVENKASCQ